jgi:hypothetical protein
VKDEYFLSKISSSGGESVRGSFDTVMSVSEISVVAKPQNNSKTNLGHILHDNIDVANADESDNDEGRIASPQISLLMSFPNSGTSYTLQNTQTVSNTSTATHYCNNDKLSFYNLPGYQDHNNTSQVTIPPHVLVKSGGHEVRLPAKYM